VGALCALATKSKVMNFRPALRIKITIFLAHCALWACGRHIVVVLPPALCCSQRLASAEDSPARCGLASRSPAATIGSWPDRRANRWPRQSWPATHSPVETCGAVWARDLPQIASNKFKLRDLERRLAAGNLEPIVCWLLVEFELSLSLTSG